MRYRLELDPFRHWVFDDFLEKHEAQRACGQFPDPDRSWTRRHHLRSRKETWDRLAEFPPAIKDLVQKLNDRNMLQYFEYITGLKPLEPDPGLFGGGMHYTGPDGFLGVHADFTHHPDTGFRRVLNLLLYLNPEWQEGDGGELELWSHDMKRCVKKYAPLHNRAVLFETSTTSYHGHPDPFRGVACRSIALYYYTPTSDGLRLKTTDYRPRPWDYRHRFRRWVKGWLKPGD